MGHGRAARLRKPASGHTDTTSITIWVRRANWNAVKAQIQCVRLASGSGPSGTPDRAVLRTERYSAPVLFAGDQEPAERLAGWGASSHSGEFGAMIANTFPGRSPSAASPEATRRTPSASSA